MDGSLVSIENDIRFQIKEWFVSRIGWGLMGLFILAGSLGLFGSGLLSDSKEDFGIFSVEYQQYLRYSVRSEITVNVKTLKPDSTVTINADFVKRIQIENIVPEPASVELKGNSLIYKFSSAEINEITFYLDPTEPGTQLLHIAIGGKMATIKQRVYF